MGGGSNSGSPAIPPEGAWVTRSCLLRERRRGGTRGWASSTAGRNPVLSQNVLFSNTELIVKTHPFASGQFTVVEYVLHQGVEVRKGTNLRRDVDLLLVGQRLLIFWNEYHACSHDFFS